MKKFDTNTGNMDFVLKASTTNNYYNNIFETKEMSGEIKLKGKLRLTEDINNY